MQPISRTCSGFKFGSTSANGFGQIFKQFRGKENIFGYRSTTSNQLYLLYCICGKIYFTDKISPLVKYAWFVINLCGVLVACTTATACLLYDKKLDIWKLLDIATWAGASTSLSVIVPIFVYYYRNSIEATIQGIDDLSKIIISKTRQTPNDPRMIELKTLMISNFYKIYALVFIHNFICILDVVFFFDEEKVRNFKYYAFPLPNTEENGSAKLFAYNCLIVVFNSPLFSIPWLGGVTLACLWGAACHNELMYLQDNINSRMDALNLSSQNRQDVDQAWCRTFRQILVQDVKAFNAINRTIDDFKEFFQLACSLAIPVNFVSQLAQMFTILSPEMTLSVRLKMISFFMMTIWPMFLLYWVGQVLENGASAVSFSVYCSPWSRSVEVRRDVQIFLSQTQKSRSLFMWKVYPLVLRNFSRLIHSVQTSVNLLREIA